MGTIGELKTKAAKRELRHDGSAPKASGFLGPLRVKGGIATEYSVGVNLGGTETEIPTLVPTLTGSERSAMVNDVIPNHGKLPRSVVDKAVLHARQRQAVGKSPFFDPKTEGRDPRRARRSFDFR